MTNISLVPPTLDYSVFNNSEFIVIDGDQGSGKSTLAQKLKKKLDAEVIEIDNYLQGNSALYVDQINYRDLCADLSKVNKTVIVEGVCMLNILEKLKLHHDFLVCTKLIDNGRWYYSPFLDDLSQKLPNSRLSKEIAQYYRQFQPFKAANLVRELCLEP